MSATHELPVRRNTFLLSAALATNSAMLQLSAAVASLTLVAVLDVEGLLGLGPAIVLASSALAALPAGRAMDRIGRVPVLAAGYLTGAAGCGLAALGSASELAPAVLGGLVLVGAASGVALLVADGGRRHVPDRAPRPRDRARPVRGGVRGDPRAGGVQPAARGPRPRRRGARTALARGGRIHAGGLRARVGGAARPAPDRRAARARARTRAGHTDADRSGAGQAGALAHDRAAARAARPSRA